MSSFKSARFLLFTLYLPALQAEGIELFSKTGSLVALPAEEQIGQAQVHLLPAKEFLDFPYLPQEIFFSYLKDQARDVSLHNHIDAQVNNNNFRVHQSHTKAIQAANTFSLALWSAQQNIANTMTSQNALHCASLPPLSAKALQAYFTPSGRYWLGLVFFGKPSALSQKVPLHLQQLFQNQLQSTKIQPFPWIPEMSSSGSWALGAGTALGPSIELLGISKSKKQ